MLDFDSFREEQERIYENFRIASEQMRREGAFADPVATSRKGGILVVFRHSLEVAHTIGELSKQIAERVPAVLYDSESIHTTIFDHGVADGRVVPQSDALLEKIGLIVSSLDRRIVGDAAVELGGILVNRTTAIVAGTPNLAFLRTAETLQKACQDEGIVVRLPWGGHVTASRFREPFPAETAASLLDFVARVPPIGKSNLVAIDIGAFRCTSDRFIVDTQTHISLE